jgi:uncharacterized protein (DUF111 family)
LIDETGTLGVRVFFCERHTINRELYSVDILVSGIRENVKVKVAKNCDGEIIRIKPEYDDLKRLAEKTNKPLRELSELVISRAREVFIETK